MNPNEKVEDIQLVPIKDKNDELLELRLNIPSTNERQTPPVALLSESHINCLGLASSWHQFELSTKRMIFLF